MRCFGKFIPLVFTVLFVLFDFSHAGPMSGFEWWETHVLDKFDFMSKFYIDCDGIFFFNHKDTTYKKRYFIETNSNLEFELVSYKQLVYSVWSLYVRTGLGRQSDVVIFDPRDSRYGLIPALELRLKPVNIKSGLEHFCFHDIDRDDEVTEYWNKPYVEVSSKNYRLGEYRQGLVAEEKWNPLSRLSWSAKLAYYWETLGGLFDKSLINGGQEYYWELISETRYAFYRRLSWLVNARLLLNYNLDRQSNLHQTYVVGMESHFRRGQGGSMFFLYYNVLDEFEVRNRDRLVEFGVRFYK